MKEVEILEFIEKPFTEKVRLTKDEWHEGKSGEVTKWNVSVKVSNKDTENVNGKSHLKRCLMICNGNILQTESNMLSYHIGDGWVELRVSLYTINSRDELDKLKKGLKVYKY